MPTTSNFGWTTPADTDLVKDGALAIRTLGNGIDTSFVDLKGGTTGQILSKASNTDLDYTWINNDQGDITGITAGTGISGGGTSGSVTITNSMATEITAAGDVIVGTGSGTFDNLPIGTTGQVLTADTTVSPYKVKWATPASATTFVGCSLYKTANQSISHDTITQVTFDSEAFDTDGFHSTTSNTSRITIPTGKGGKYLFTFQTQWDLNGTGDRSIYYYKNGTNGTAMVRYSIVSGSYYTIQNASIVLDLVAGDYIEMYVLQSSGGNLNILYDTNTAQSSRIRFSASYLGA